jgi:ureidoglycolate hydrolase
MTLPARHPHPLGFRAITFHAHVSQCLAALDAAWAPWYLAVAAPSGSVGAFPRQEDITAFRIPPGVFVKLHPGTWHAGPLFESAATMAFANLEMADTNVSDHNTHVYEEGFVVVPPPG